VLRCLSVLCLLTVVRADPFVGKWRLNPSKSRLPDEMIVAVAGPNRYALTFAPGAVDTIVADGRDHPALQGTTFSITVEGSNNWKMVRKQGDHLLVSAEWTLSGDGQTLTDAFTGYRPDGSTLSVHYTYERTAGSSGFPGTWDSVKEEVGTVIELTIQYYEGDGLSFDSHELTLAKKITFDGRDSLSSARRVNERSLEITDKSQGKVTSTQQVELSSDLKTLTMTARQGDHRKPTVLVFERE
jgi:hypothetical protein